jgi:ribosome-binding protein aMBF1 (putative translation factor)
MDWYGDDEYYEDYEDRVEKERHLERLKQLDMEQDIDFEEDVIDEWDDNWELDEDQKAIKDWETSLPRDDRDGIHISPKYRDADSDVTIISSDEVYFMVHSFILKRSS